MIEKRIFIFAGPNGSGKSTVINNFLNESICPKYYICPDNLVDKDKKNSKEEYIKAMNYAETLRFEALKNGVSFTFETVLSTIEKLDFIKQAKEINYKITTIYVTTSDYNININRIKERVKRGGHDVPTDKVISRYEKCMNLMSEVISLSDDAKIFDNSSKIPVLVFEKTRDGQHFLLNREQRHSWVSKYIKSEKFLITLDLSCSETDELEN